MIVTVTPSWRPSFWKAAAENIVRQCTRPVASVLVRHKTTENSRVWEDLLTQYGICPHVLTAQDEWMLGDVLRYGFDYAHELVENGLIATMDDDDLYLPLYLTELEDFFAEHQDAAIIGKQTYRVRFCDGTNRIPKLMCPRWTPNPQQVYSVAGPTIAVNIEKYRENPSFRHPAGDPIADVGIIMAALACDLPIYSTTPEHFWLQRFGPQHKHGWVWDGE